jgi:NADH dehydrogenase/NADH oxidase (H2O2-forming)
MQHYEILVIGGGPAAISLVKVIGTHFKTGVIRPEDHSLIYCAMPYAIEQLIPVQKTFKRDELVLSAGADLLRDTCSAVDFDAKVVTTLGGEQYSYSKLVVATGAKPVLPPLPGSGLPGVHTFKTEADMLALSAVLEQGATHAAVIGAGAIGIELAQALASRGLETHLVDIATSILPNMADPDMLGGPTEELVKAGIHLHLGHGVAALNGTDRVESIQLTNGEEIHLAQDDCSTSSKTAQTRPLVVFAVGMRPDIDLFRGSTLEMGRQGIIVNGRMETSIPDVYAIGDCVQFSSAITGELQPGKLATNAVPMGKLLAKNLLGGNVEYQGFYNGAATKVGMWYVGSVGLTETQARSRYPVLVGEAELTTTFPIMPEAKAARLKVVVNKETGLLLGAQITSGAPVADKVDQLTMAIQYGIKASDLEFFSYSSQPYQSYYPADNLLIHAIKDLK